MPGVWQAVDGDRAGAWRLAALLLSGLLCEGRSGSGRGSQ